MTNEKRYAAALYMLQSWEDAMHLEGIARDVEKEPRKWMYNKNFPVAAAAAEIMVDALDGMATKRTGKTVFSAVKRIYENNGDMRPAFYGIFQTGKKWAVCDGYRAVRLNSDIPELEHVAPEAVQSLGRLIDGAKKEEALELPSVADVKAWIAAHGGKKYATIKPMPLGGLTAVNALYLLDMLQALENVRAYIPGSDYEAIYFEGDNGDGILLPVRTEGHGEIGAEIRANWKERRKAAGLRAGRRVA